MKRVKKLLYLVVVLVSVLYSCSTENEKSVKLLQKIVETSKEGFPETILFTYNGNEIVAMEDTRNRTEFKYKDGLIASIVVLNKASKIRETINYLYDAGKLVQVESVGNHTINYNHNVDKTISYEQFSINGNSPKVKKHSGVLTFENGNCTNDYRTIDNDGKGIVLTHSRTFKYDQKINPFSVIAGFDKLLSHDEFMSSNNSFSTVVIENKILPNDKLTSSATMHTSIFKYDLDEYPVEKVSHTAPLPNGNKGYIKTEYFY